MFELRVSVFVGLLAVVGLHRCSLSFNVDRPCVSIGCRSFWERRDF